MRVASTSSRSPSGVFAFALHRRSISLSAASWSRLVRIGLISVAVMLNLFHIDLVVISVRADPFDPDDALLEIDGDNQPVVQPVVVPLDVEHNPICQDDAGSSIAALYISSAGPPRLLDFIEPRIQGGLQRS